MTDTSLQAVSPRAPWILFPLRLFMSITFIYAGIQKLLDPQFFQPGSSGYIGKQLQAFALSSPLHAIILGVAVPQASFIGILIAYGEIAIGLGILFGCLFRLASCFGLLLNILFFLTASWNTYPYFYGSDLVFIVCWITLILNGPVNTGLPILDTRLVLFFLKRTAPGQREQRARTLSIIFGVTFPKEVVPAIDEQLDGASEEHGTRRAFLFGALAGGIGIIGAAAVIAAVQILKRPVVVAPNQIVSSTEPITASSSTATSSIIAYAKAIPADGALKFTLASTGEPGLLIKLANGQLVAYDAVCTHAGCQVDYDTASHLIICPCHGAQFDPAQQGAVLHPPASRPLNTIAIQIDSKTGAITPASD